MSDIQNIGREFQNLSSQTIREWNCSGYPWIKDTYPSNASKQLSKILSNEYFCQYVARIFEFLRTRCIYENSLMILILDGKDLFTTRYLAKTLPCLLACNVLVPNFTDVVPNQSDECTNCTPLFMKAGPVIPDHIKRQFPPGVRVYDLFSVLKETSLPHAAIWLDYCATPDYAHENIVAAVTQLTFAPVVIFGVTVTLRKASLADNAKTLDEFIFGVLSQKPDLYHSYRVQRLQRMGKPSAPTLFYLVEKFLTKDVIQLEALPIEAPIAK